MMGRTVSEAIARLPKARRRKVERRAQELIRDEMSLRELRLERRLTQSEVARLLGKGQDAVSRIEQRSDLLVSTLRDYIESLGGELELVCRFKGRPPVTICGPAEPVTRRRR
jgi:DNA-binding XRE family transcriptional regulator